MRRGLPGKKLLAAALAASLLAGGGTGRIFGQERTGELVEMISSESENIGEDPLLAEPQEEEAAPAWEEEDRLSLQPEEEESLAGEEKAEEESPSLAEETLLEEIPSGLGQEEIPSDAGDGPSVEDVPPEEEPASDEERMEPEELSMEQDEGEELLEIVDSQEELLQTELFMAASDYPETEGTAIAGKGSEYKLVSSGANVYKGNYNLLGDTNNKKKFVYKPFNDAGDHVIYWEHQGGVLYFVPKDMDAVGKYGFLVENVGFNCEENCKLDMRFTVTGYKNYMLDKYGNKVEGIYPAFGLWTQNGVCFAFGGSDQNIKVEILKHGTNTRVKGDYSFRWLDVDAGQRFGISLIDGELTGRYAMKTCTASYQNDFSRFNRTYQMVNANQEVDYKGKTEDWMNGTVYWEVKGCSQMNLLIASAGNSQKGRYAPDTVRTRYNNYVTNTFPDDKVEFGALAWDGESYGPRENPMPLKKYVSNTAESMETLAGKLENTLPSHDTPFYYYLTNYVPVESPDYYYNLYKVTDSLPTGVVYDGWASVTKAETDEDVSGWFQIQEQDGVVSFSAKNMGKSSFYGSTFLFAIRVRLNKGAMAPAYEGNECVYTARNKAAVVSRHKTDLGESSSTSNEVATTLRELGQGRLLVQKTSLEGAPLGGAVYEVKVRDNILSPSGILLAAAGTVVGQVTTGADGNAFLEGLYAGMYLVTELQPPRGYSLNTAPQEAAIHGPGMGMEPSTVIFHNERTVVYLRKVSSLAQGETERRAIPGVRFRIWNKYTAGEDQGAVHETDGTGTIRLEGYEPGTYCWREMAPAPGYASNPGVGEFVIDERGLVGNRNGFVIEVENICLAADFIKTDRVTGEAVAGATLRLTDEAGNEVETWVSENVPHRISRLPAGTYVLTELEAPGNYKKARPVTCVITDTPQVQTYSISDVKYVDVELTKTILAEEVVWAHGNPTFTFCLTGTDLDGEPYAYRRAVVFSQEAFGEQKEGRMSLKTVLHVPAGVYQAWELPTARYRQKEIASIENGKPEGGGVSFSLSENQNGRAEFINEKTTDEYLTHTDFVRNVIIGE